jgi:hypothetical protein
LLINKAIGQITEWRGRRKNGEIFPFELSMYEVPTPQGKSFAGSIKDILERQETAALIDRSLEAVRAFAEQQEIKLESAPSSATAKARAAFSGFAFPVDHLHATLLPPRITKLRLPFIL